MTGHRSTQFPYYCKWWQCRKEIEFSTSFCSDECRNKFMEEYNKQDHSFFNTIAAAKYGCHCDHEEDNK